MRKTVYGLWLRNPPSSGGRVVAGRIQHVTLQIASSPVRRGEYGEVWSSAFRSSHSTISNLDYDKIKDVDNVAFPFPGSLRTAFHPRPLVVTYANVTSASSCVFPPCFTSTMSYNQTDNSYMNTRENGFQVSRIESFGMAWDILTPTTSLSRWQAH